MRTPLVLLHAAVLLYAVDAFPEMKLRLVVKNVTPEKPRVGDPIFFQIAFRNDAAKDLRMRYIPDYETPQGIFLSSWRCRVWQGNMLVGEKPPADLPGDYPTLCDEVPARGELNPSGPDDSKRVLNNFLPDNIGPGTYEVEIIAYRALLSEDTKTAKDIELSARFPLSLLPGSKESQRESYKQLLAGLRRGMNPNEFRCAQSAVKTLAKPEFTDLLLDALDNKDVPQTPCVQALGRLSTASDPKVVKKLLEIAATGDEGAKTSAAMYLRDSVKAEHLPILVENLKSSNDLLRFHTLALVRKIGTKDAARVIVNSLGDPSMTVRSAAASHLGALGFPESLGDLKVALDREQEPGVQIELRRAVSRLEKSAENRPPPGQP